MESKWKNFIWALQNNLCDKFDTFVIQQCLCWSPVNCVLYLTLFKKNGMVELWSFLEFFRCILCQYSEAYSEPSQTSKMEFFAKIVNGFQLLTISAKRSIVDVWQCLEYTYDIAVTCYKTG